MGKLDLLSELKTLGVNVVFILLLSVQTGGMTSRRNNSSLLSHRKLTIRRFETILYSNNNNYMFVRTLCPFFESFIHKTSQTLKQKRHDQVKRLYWI